jgi:hypothetical protein
MISFLKSVSEVRLYPKTLVKFIKILLEIQAGFLYNEHVCRKTGQKMRKRRMIHGDVVN